MMIPRVARVAGFLAGLISMLALAAPALADHGATSCRGQDVPVSKWTLIDAEHASLCLLNLYRQANGLAPLAQHQALAGAGRDHAEDMVERDYFDHNAPPPAPNGRTPSERAQNSGYPGGAGENIAANGHPRTTAHDLFDQWKASFPHHENMLSRRWDTGEPIPYEVAAVGLALGAPEINASGGRLGPNGLTGVQMFGLVKDGATYTALDLAGGDPSSTADCGPASAARANAKQRWQKAKKARKKAIKRKRQARSGKERRRAKRSLNRKSRQVSKRRRQLKRASERQKATC